MPQSRLYASNIAIDYSAEPQPSISLSSPFFSDIAWCRISQTFVHRDKEPFLKVARKQTCLGIYGIVKLLSQTILVIIEDAAPCGFHSVFQCRKFGFILLPPSEVIGKDKDKYVSSSNDFQNDLLGFLNANAKHFYGSFREDFSENCARKTNHSTINVSLGYMWNEELVGQFPSNNWVVPIIYGYVGQFWTKTSQVCLVSRRSHRNTGMRYHSRGINAEGYAANLVESELIVQEGTCVTSYVVLRGSLPVEWSQPITGRYKPLTRVQSTSSEPTSQHFKMLNTYYKGGVACLSVLRKAELTEQQNLFSRYSESIGIRLLTYDIMENDVMLSLERIRECSSIVSSQLLDASLTCYVGENLEKKQELYLRVNCVDCTDRTNIVQASILWSKLSEMESLISDSPDFLCAAHARLCKENGDALAVQYVGTSALYTDILFYRLPSRITSLRDGLKAVKRYVLSIFCQGSQQDRLVLSSTRHVATFTHHSTNVHVLFWRYIIISTCYFAIRKPEFCFWVPTVPIVLTIFRQLSFYFSCSWLNLPTLRAESTTSGSYRLAKNE